MKDINEHDQAIYGDRNELPLVISKITYDRIHKLDNYADVIAVYMRYCAIVYWRHKISIYATTSFMAKGCGISELRIRKAKKDLLALGLIEDVIKRNESNTAIHEHRIKVNYISVNPKETYTNEFTQDTKKVYPNKNAQGTNLVGNIYSTEELKKSNTEELKKINVRGKNEKIVRKRKQPKEQEWIERIKILEDQLKIEKLKNQPIQIEMFEKDELISEKHFDQFYNLYPNRVDKGTAHKAWMNLCTQKSKQKIRPTWKVVQKALKGHIKSERWQDPNFTIPNPSTWINGERWNNDPKDMKKLNFDNKFVPKKTERFGFVGKTKTEGIDRIDIIA